MTPERERGRVVGSLGHVDTESWSKAMRHLLRSLWRRRSAPSAAVVRQLRATTLLNVMMLCFWLVVALAAIPVPTDDPTISGWAILAGSVVVGVAGMMWVRRRSLGRVLLATTSGFAAVEYRKRFFAGTSFGLVPGLCGFTLALVLDDAAFDVLATPIAIALLFWASPRTGDVLSIEKRFADNGAGTVSLVEGLTTRTG